MFDGEAREEGGSGRAEKEGKRGGRGRREEEKEREEEEGEDRSTLDELLVGWHDWPWLEQGSQALGRPWRGVATETAVELYETRPPRGMAIFGSLLSLLSDD